MSFIPPGKVVACDTETTGGNPRKGSLPFAYSFCNTKGKTGYVEFPVDPKTRRVMYEKKPKAAALLRKFFTDPKITKVYHNRKFDQRMVEAALDIEIRGRQEDTMIAALCCNSGELNAGLKPLAKKYCGIPDDDQKLLRKAIMKLRNRAKKRGWAIAGKHNDVDEESADATAKQKKKSALDMDYWLCQYARELLGDNEEADEVERLCEFYATTDAVRTIVLWLFYSELMEEIDVSEVYELELKLLPTTMWMEDRGVRVSLQEIERLEKQYQAQRDKTDKVIAKFGKLFKMPNFNPRSHPQLSTMLYKKLKLPIPSRIGKKKQSKSGMPTDQDALLELSVLSELPNTILLNRAATKALQFVTKYRERAEEADGYLVLHCDFNQIGPRTGRYSARNPNLQQTASRSTGRSANPIDVRAPFGPAPGYWWYNIDYSQLEVRIFADLSQEQEMLRIIESGQHIHKACADHVWGGHRQAAYDAAEKAMGLHLSKSSPEITDAMREARAKYRNGVKAIAAFDGSIVAFEASLDKKNTVNKAKLAIFTRLFGGGIPSIMNLMKCSREEASTFLREYSEAFPGMEPWMRRTGSESRRKGYCLTAFGRRIKVDPEFAYRSVNYIVQGSAADLMKRALRSCSYYLQEQLPGQGWIVMTIHDEIVFELSRKVPPMRHVGHLKALMEDHGGVFGIRLPAEVECVKERWVDKESVPWVSKLSTCLDRSMVERCVVAANALSR